MEAIRTKISLTPQAGASMSGVGKVEIEVFRDPRSGATHVRIGSEYQPTIEIGRMIAVLESIRANASRFDQACIMGEEIKALGEAPKEEPQEAPIF